MKKSALILCGGFGTRFRKVSSSPKILASFRDKLFIDWLLEFIALNSFEEIFLSIGNRGSEIEHHVSKFYPNANIKIIHEENPLGTGGAVKYFFELYPMKEVYVFNGDTFYSQKIPELLFTDYSCNKILCLCKKLDLNIRFGDFSIVDGKLNILRGSEKTPILNSQVYCGIARVPIDILKNNRKSVFSFEELLRGQKNTKLIFYEGEFLDYGVPEDYTKLEKKYGV